MFPLFKRFGMGGGGGSDMFNHALKGVGRKQFCTRDFLIFLAPLSIINDRPSQALYSGVRSRMLESRRRQARPRVGPGSGWWEGPSVSMCI